MIEEGKTNLSTKTLEYLTFRILGGCVDGGYTYKWELCMVPLLEQDSGAPDYFERVGSHDGILITRADMFCSAKGYAQYKLI